MVSEGVCECGCGGGTVVIRYPSQGKVGQHRRFKRGHWARVRPQLSSEERLRRKREGQRRDDLKTYGITIEDWDAMYEAQAGCCGICGTDKCVTGKRLAVDHDHVTGMVRGLLCASCNNALGRIEKTGVGAETWFIKARKYLTLKGI